MVDVLGPGQRKKKCMLLTHFSFVCTATKTTNEKEKQMWARSVSQAVLVLLLSAGTAERLGETGRERKREEEGKAREGDDEVRRERKRGRQGGGMMERAAHLTVKH